MLNQKVSQRDKPEIGIHPSPDRYRSSSNINSPHVITIPLIYIYTGQFDKAVTYYKKAEDYLSLVRVYCYQHNIEEVSNLQSLSSLFPLIPTKYMYRYTSTYIFLSQARRMAIESNDVAACYHLARHYENEENVSTNREVYLPIYLPLSTYLSPVIYLSIPRLLSTDSNS